MDNAALTPRPISLAGRLKFAYNELDIYMRRTLKAGAGTAHRDLIKRMVKINPLFGSAHYDLDTFANLRNAIEHNHLPDAPPIAEPHEAAVDEYERLVKRLVNPPPALSIAVPLAKIFTTAITERVYDVVTTMNQYDYTHVPILRDGTIVGVFSENTLFSFLAARGDKFTIAAETQIAEMGEFLPLNRHASEQFAFLPKDSPMGDLLLCFRNSFAAGKRLGAVFITEDGRDTGRLLGLATAWDIAAGAG